MPTTSLSHAAFCGYGFRPRASRAPERRPGNDVRDVGLRLHGLEQDAFESSKGWARSLVMIEQTQSAPNPAAPEAAITAALGKRLIVLVGMMGVGKSTVGRRLAARLRLPFVDADTEIETAADMTIPEIFESRGEDYFRNGEARVIARLLENGPAVLATGGGAFMREETRRRIHEKAVSIWLKADADVIMRRVRRRADRPLLQTADPEGTVARLLSEREPVYQLADLTICSRDVPHDRVVEDCIEALQALLLPAPEAEVQPATPQSDPGQTDPVQADPVQADSMQTDSMQAMSALR